MDFETVKAWLEKLVHRQIRNRSLAGMLGLILAPVAVAVASASIYALCWVFTSRGGVANHPLCIWTTLGIIPCLFIANRFTPKRNLMEERMADGVDGSLAGHYASRQTAKLYFFLWIMFTGPRLLDWALYCFREVKRLKQLDTHSCAGVIWVLLSRPKKVPLDDIQLELPWLDMPAVLPQLRGLEGVVYLPTPPEGLSLTEDLRKAIRSGQV